MVWWVLERWVACITSCDFMLGCWLAVLGWFWDLIVDSVVLMLLRSGGLFGLVDCCLICGWVVMML